MGIDPVSRQACSKMLILNISKYALHMIKGYFDGILN